MRCVIATLVTNLCFKAAGSCMHTCMQPLFICFLGLPQASAGMQTLTEGGDVCKGRLQARQSGVLP